MCYIQHTRTCVEIFPEWSTNNEQYQRMERIEKRVNIKPSILRLFGRLLDRIEKGVWNVKLEVACKGMKTLMQSLVTI